MRQQVEDNRMEGPPSSESMEGKACSLTKRIMTVSPFPERMNSLLHLLTAECFDLFTLHDLNKAFVSSLQPELIIYDATPHPLIPDAIDALHAAMTQTSPINGASLLYLVHEDARIMAAAIPKHAELLAWPSNPQEALNQINRMLGEWKAPDLSSYRFKDLTVDLKKMAVFRGGERIELTKTEYDLLLMFLTSDGAVLTREAMFDAVWGSQYFGGSNVVDVHIKTLRRKLKDSAVAPHYIATVRGVGYRLVEERGN
ncbi:winged helix-turn-helix domain-containing protein [Paenibacillus sp. JDR-2]|uniref:winged helix-turn-helix domain-containing protein n=1 Tax=Paenibacillus sp. (strain JDR-2) TaxID=324057 RepID=UPI0001668627|nr:winged helix-turn-helix domain-containing protein [Paenibacillus sp. JDR-2]ACT04491.1 putative two component transcriptional regulator, winged helix family [Paenibacillus sp. JDR-2]